MRQSGRGDLRGYGQGSGRPVIARRGGRAVSRADDRTL
jgi:hypothetical protein